MKRNGKRLITVIAGSAVTLFSASACVVGTLAWFSFQQQVTASGAFVSVVTQNYSVKSIGLYKFNYAKDSYDEDSYLFTDPEKGGVGKYNYNYQTNKFYDSVTKTETTVMNLYDPLERLISGASFDLTKFNSNAVYEIVVSTTSNVGTVYLDASSYLKTFETAPSYILSDYADFDIYTESDLSNASLHNQSGDPAYLPSSRTTDRYNSNLESTGFLSGDGGLNTFDILGVVDDYYLDKTYNGNENKFLYKKASNGWQTVNLSGNSANPNSGAGVSGNAGDFYIQKTQNGNVLFEYVEDEAPWKIASIDFSFPEFPSEHSFSQNTLKNGDIYYDSNANKYYVCVNHENPGVDSSWDLIEGANAGNPNNGTGVSGQDGDFCIDTTSRILYVYNQDDPWQTIQTISVMNVGSDGIDIGGFLDNTGNIGDIVIDKATNNYFYKESSGWQKQTSVKNGQQPPSELTPEAKYYVQTSNQKLYIYNNGWPNSPTDSSSYFSSNQSGAPSNVPNSVKDSIYVDFASAAVYEKKTSGWVKKTNLVDEELYYKVSYLSANLLPDRKSHAHFYVSEGETKPNSISLNPINQVYKKSEGSWSSFTPMNHGIETPNDNSGQENDIYFDYGYNKAYKKTNGWVDQSAPYGSVNPNDANPAITGEYYIQTGVNKLFHYEEDKEPWKKVDITLSGTISPSSNDFANYVAETVKEIKVNDIYLDMSANKLYICTAVTAANETVTYTWNQLTAKYESLNPNVSPTYSGVGAPTFDENAELIIGDCYYDTENNKTYVYSEVDNALIWVLKDWTYDSNGKYIAEPNNWNYFVDTTNSGVYYVYTFAMDNQPWKETTPTFTEQNSDPGINTGKIGDTFYKTGSNQLFVRTYSWDKQNTMISDGPQTDNNAGDDGDYCLDVSGKQIPITFTADPQEAGKYLAKIYINVNYSPRQLEQFSQNTSEKFIANVDFAFSFSFNNNGGNN